MSSPFPSLIPTFYRGTLQCGFVTVPGTAGCDAPATWHIAWHLTPGDADFSLLCDPHMADVQQRYVYADRHPAETACDMPGTGWLAAEPSRCVLAPTADAGTREGRAR